MTSILNIMDLSNPVFQAYVFWCTILVLKMLAMAPLTGHFRFKTQTFPTKEDAEKFSKDKKVKIDEDVERVRRAHLNDIENIPAFITVAFFYMLTQPDEILAINLIRIAAIARIVHTYAYVFLQKHQPRGIAWALCFGVTMFMGVNVLCAFT